jgi:superfamily I DNA and/or RNA helicase
VNDKGAAVATNIAHGLLRHAYLTASDLMLVTFYQADLKQTTRLLKAEGWQAQQLRLQTVDATQGDETAIVSIHAVREKHCSNRFGFTGEASRKNTATSRASIVHIIIGNLSNWKRSYIYHY